MADILSCVLYPPDNDECTLDTDNCTQVCVNTDGGFNCTCRDGYSLDEDGISCEGRALSSHFDNTKV